MLSPLRPVKLVFETQDKASVHSGQTAWSKPYRIVGILIRLRHEDSNAVGGEFQTLVARRLGRRVHPQDHRRSLEIVLHCFLEGQKRGEEENLEQGEIYTHPGMLSRTRPARSAPLIPVRFFNLNESADLSASQSPPPRSKTFKSERSVPFRAGGVRSTRLPQYSQWQK